MSAPSSSAFTTRMEQVAPWIVTVLSLVTMMVFLWEPIDPNPRKEPAPASAQTAPATSQPTTPTTAPATLPAQQTAADTQGAAASAKKTSDTSTPEPDRKALRILAALTSASIVLWGVHCFVGDPYVLRRHEVGFAYFVMVLSFVVFAAPLVVKNQAIGTEPIGILSACVLGDGGDKLLSCRPEPPPKDCSTQTTVPEALACERGRKTTNFQWVLNVGGTLSTPKDGASPDCPSSNSRDPMCKLGSQKNRAAITGGMVLPLPFLVIALIGGAISMSRRIPEIQKRSEPDYVGTATDPKLLPCEVREHLVFQIVQFFSAPLLAIVAYQVIHPETDSTAAALAFMSGFGSEAVLLAIRGVFDGIKTRTVPAAPAPATLSGLVLHNKGPVANAIVALAAGGRTTRSGQNGRYSFADVSLGAGKVSATDGARSGSKAFNMPAGGMSCDIELEDPAVPPPHGGGGNGAGAAVAPPPPAPAAAAAPPLPVAPVEANIDNEAQTEGETQ